MTLSTFSAPSSSIDGTLPDTCDVLVIGGGPAGSTIGMPKFGLEFVSPDLDDSAMHTWRARFVVHLPDHEPDDPRHERVEGPEPPRTVS